MASGHDPSKPRAAVLADPRLDPEQVRDVLVRAVQRACPAWLAAHREDIVQAAMTKLLSAKRDEHGRPLSRSYLWRVAYSEVADEIRRLRGRTEITMTEAVEDVATEPGQGNPDQSVALRELGEALRDCLRGVMESRRLVVQFHMLGHDLREIEGLTGADAKKVRNLLYRGLSDLRSCLGKKGFRP